MSTNALIIGESGTGKSASLRNLNPEETFIINTINKPLPFPKWKEKYQSTGDNINLLLSDNSATINKYLQGISERRTEIKTVVIDDFQYIMANEFMRRHSSMGKGNSVFTLYNDIGDHAWNIFMTSNSLREDLIVVMLSHSEQNDLGKTKCKTIGKMLDDKITVEGMFTIVLETHVEDGKYFFRTQNNGHNTAKTPMGMFDEELIENDLNTLITKIKEY